jgi:hypothetical protein
MDINFVRHGVAPPEKALDETTYPVELFEQAFKAAAVNCRCRLVVTGFDHRNALSMFIYSAAEYSKVAQTPKELRRFPPYC